MAVNIGSARIDENGKAHGGKAGDQTGRELSTQPWYKHAKGWVVLRPKSLEIAERIARCMEMACANQKIGYDQYQRDTLYNAAKPLGFDVSKIAAACETDCSALVRVCMAYAGIMVASFRTTTQAAVMAKTGQFDKLTASKYTAQSAYLKRGDVLVTKTQGHTVVVLTDGPKAERVYALGERTIQYGMTGPDVADAQKALTSLDIPLPKYGADGDFGAETLKAVKAFEARAGLIADGALTITDIRALLAVVADGWPAEPAQAIPEYKCLWAVATADVNVRYGPGTGYKKHRVLLKGAFLMYDGATVGGWYAVLYRGVRAWVSGAYARLEVGPKYILDLSVYDDVRDWGELARYVSYVWHRVGIRSLTSNGTIKIDGKFKASAAAMRARGIPFGAYFYGRAKTAAQAVAEADAAIAWAEPYGPTTYAYDIEAPTNTREAVQAFVDRITQRTGKPCGIYVGRRWKQVAADKLRVAFRWGPYYLKNGGGTHGRNPTNAYDVHQYTCSGRIPGKADDTDVNHLHALSIEWFRSGGKGA